eukprot:PhF_6_TR42655/c0_g1_i1/m.64249
MDCCQKYWLNVLKRLSRKSCRQCTATFHWISWFLKSPKRRNNKESPALCVMRSLPPTPWRRTSTVTSMAQAEEVVAVEVQPHLPAMVAPLFRLHLVGVL